MNFQKKLIASGIVSAITLIASIILPIVPCKISPAIPNPKSSWTLCSLNPDIVSTSHSVKEYLGYTTSLTDTYFLVILIAFVASMIFIHFTAKNKKD